MKQMQLDFFAPDAPDEAKRENPFSKIQGVNLFGKRALFTGFCDCTGGDLSRLGYAA